VSVLCPCGKTARKGHACTVTRLRAELGEALDLLQRADLYSLVDGFDGSRMYGLEKDVRELLRKHGRKP
jgi:hypothetical protein